ncbi:hypothetical protein [Aureimonas jatrophae]|uniref:Hemolysin-type calcium-binding repeat-containing protein n=1 Tax=Aureimonas jatrophae TaxID=1166073 RepID=A0A1H0HAN1_9HYPH|nr:hypothetical protein [Aureimonas jatrophae]MBB3950494.1 Ca2+-binding RTX toxin-like protein [Aureimonas jatrophae]SDO16266.1 hypothetical protein SAMN05192530_1043 [Aureimonas jatrophae]
MAVFGTTDNNNLAGNTSGNITTAGFGNDTLFEDQDNDTLNGGRRDNVLVGGLGSNTFVFVPGQGNDIVTNFSIEDGDVLDLQSEMYALTTARGCSAALLLSEATSSSCRVSHRHSSRTPTSPDDRYSRQHDRGPSG